MNSLLQDSILILESLDYHRQTFVNNVELLILCLGFDLFYSILSSSLSHQNPQKIIVSFMIFLRSLGFDSLIDRLLKLYTVCEHEFSLPITNI